MARRSSEPLALERLASTQGQLLVLPGKTNGVSTAPGTTFQNIMRRMLIQPSNEKFRIGAFYAESESWQRGTSGLFECIAETSASLHVTIGLACDEAAAA